MLRERARRGSSRARQYCASVPVRRAYRSASTNIEQADRVQHHHEAEQQQESGATAESEAPFNSVCRSARSPGASGT